MKTIEKKLSDFTNVVTEEKENLFTISTPPEHLYEIASFLHKEAGYDFLIDIVGMDYGDSFGVIHYLSQSQNPLQLVALKA